MLLPIDAILWSKNPKADAALRVGALPNTPHLSKALT